MGRRPHNTYMEKAYICIACCLIKLCKCIKYVQIISQYITYIIRYFATKGPKTWYYICKAQSTVSQGEAKKKGLDKKCKSKQEQLLLYPTDQHESCHSRERKSGSLEWLYVIVKRQDRIWYKLDIDSCAQIVNKVDLQHTRQNKQLMTKYMMESFMSNVHSKKVHKNPPVWRKLRLFGGHSTSLY